MDKKILCACGCNKEITIKSHMKYTGIPKYIRGHNPKKKLKNQENIKYLLPVERKKKYQDPRYLKKKILKYWITPEELSKQLPKNSKAKASTIKKYLEEFNINYNDLIHKKLKQYNDPTLILMPGSSIIKKSRIEINRYFIKQFLDEDEKFYKYRSNDFILKKHGRGVINFGNNFEFWSKLIITLKKTDINNIYNVLNFKLSEIFAFKEMLYAFPEKSKKDCEKMILDANKKYISEATKIIWRK